MDDIVKRIRQQSYFGLEPYEAADEIEQLRKQLIEAYAEIERLKIENISFACNLRGKHATTGATYEILRTQLTASKDREQQFRNEITTLRQRVAELEKQRDELLAALERLSFAAMCRDSTMGDQCRLIEVMAELAIHRLFVG